MSSLGVPDVNVDYDAGKDEQVTDYPSLQAKIRKTTTILTTALEQYTSPAMLWTGGKDSTLLLYLLRETASKHGYELPPAVFIDHYQHFPETHTFIETWSATWGIDVIQQGNTAAKQYIDSHDVTPGDEIPVSALTRSTRTEVQRDLDYTDNTFPFALDTYVGNHVFKTVPLHDAIRTHEFDAVITGIRWDEQDARSSETFFSPRRNTTATHPVHDRIHPILQFAERDVWDATWRYVVPDSVPQYPEEYVPGGKADLPTGVTWRDVPVMEQYADGYRSLGSRVTDALSTTPAWLQDIDGTSERAGRAQNKESLMEKLRDLGYM